VVDAGRPPLGDWALELDGPSAVDVGLAASDAAIDSATRLSVAAFRTMVEDWRRSIVDFRCSLPESEARKLLERGAAWNCDDLRVYVGTVGFEGLPRELAEGMRKMPTRLVLPPGDIDLAIEAGRAAVLGNRELLLYLRERVTRPQ
jgi:NTE family protein